jgi:NAD-dependent DNA ligase
LVADGQLNDAEINFLHIWLLEHPELASTWPGEIVYDRVMRVLDDGIIAVEERQYLIETLNQLIGGAIAEDGATPIASITLPVDEDEQVLIVSKSFCFTGKFVFGTRAACEREVLALGGVAADSVTSQLSYLVIGELSSRDWKNSSFGTKIERAVKFRDSGAAIRIVSECQWVTAIRRR